MLKFILASLLMTFMGIGLAQADQGSELSLTTSATAASQQSVRHNFFVRWRDVRTGQNISGWVPSDRPVCGHGSACACNGYNECGEYGSGETAYYWDRGCSARPRVIVCDVQ